MRQIKEILKREDVAASIVLATPANDESAPEKFKAIKHNHLDTSFSFAHTIKKFCCEKHGTIEGVMIHCSVDDKDDGSGKKKLLQTAGMFASLGTGTRRNSDNFKEVLQALEKGITSQSKNNDGFDFNTLPKNHEN